MSRCPIPLPSSILNIFFGLPIPYKNQVALIIAITLDLLDFLGGGIPPLNLVIDVIGFLILLPLIGVPAILTLGEASTDLSMPLIGLLPTYTAITILSIILEQQCKPIPVR